MNIYDQLELHEGRRHTPYTDTEGHLTIGIGHNLSKPLSDKAIEQILKDDIADAKADLDTLWLEWRELNKSRQNVLIDMMFNLGMPTYAQFVKFWAAIKRGDYLTAADEMLDSRWAEQVKTRAKRLADMMRDG